VQLQIAFHCPHWFNVRADCCAAKPKLPADFEETTWAKLQAAVRAVHSKSPVSCSLEELYRVMPFTGCRGRMLIHVHVHEPAVSW
jgi:hypothetical protein